MSSSDLAVMAPDARRDAPSTEAAPGSLAGLIGVLDRADSAALLHRMRTAERRSVRPAPIRSVQPAPMARPGRVPVAAAPLRPRVVVVPEPERPAVGGLRGLFHRAALWGAGAHGENLTWRTPAPAPRPSRLEALRDLTRRAALWGAGPRGEHLAWGRPRPAAAPREVDPPVVLRAMPSTPLIQHAAPSPAASLRPAIPAPRPAGPRIAPRTRTVAACRPPAPAPSPAAVPAPPARAGWAPAPTGWPQPPAWLSWVTAAPAARPPSPQVPVARSRSASPAGAGRSRDGPPART